MRQRGVRSRQWVGRTPPRAIGGFGCCCSRASMHAVREAPTFWLNYFAGESAMPPMLLAGPATLKNLKALAARRHKGNVSALLATRERSLSGPRHVEREGQAARRRFFLGAASPRHSASMRSTVSSSSGGIPYFSNNLSAHRHGVTSRSKSTRAPIPMTSLPIASNMELSSVLFALRCSRPLCIVVAPHWYDRAHDGANSRTVGFAPNLGAAVR
jgi:hypothetical protein